MRHKKKRNAVNGLPLMWIFWRKCKRGHEIVEKRADLSRREQTWAYRGQNDKLLRVVVQGRGSLGLDNWLEYIMKGTKEHLSNTKYHVVRS